MRQAKLSYPVISIAIATYNSEKTLEKTLQSINKQTYPKNKIEVLIIDGGSKDKTLAVAKKFNSIIIPNPKVDFINAKHIAFLRAKGKYLLYLDSDEILESKRSLALKYLAFSNKNVKAVMPSGYKSPPNVSPINDYVNEFGDPFTYFIYRESKGFKHLINDWSRRYNVLVNDENYIIFDFKKNTYLPQIELFAGGCIIDLQFIKKNFPQIKKTPTAVPHIFYLLIANNNFLAFTKNDNTIHYSCESFQKYLKKINSRIRNNVFLNNIGQGGYSGREKFLPSSFSFKKYLFIPYTLSVIFPLYDGSMLAITRKKTVYLTHEFLCLYTTFFILYYLSLKFLGITPQIKAYGK
jgi:glycosyltransferase involved in cell wall biosynthesis